MKRYKAVFLVFSGLSLLSLIEAQNEEFKLAAISSPPFVIVTSDENQTTYSGFVHEFFSALQKEGKCTFQFQEKIPFRTPNNTWAAVVNEVKKSNVIGVGPFTKSDSTNAQMLKHNMRFQNKFADHQGWTVVMKKMGSKKRDMIKEALTLFKPFEATVWLAILVAFAVVGVFLALVNLVNPYEWRNLYKSEKIPKTDASQLSPMSSIFVVFSTLTWQGYEKTPRSVAGRVLLIFWFAFVTVTLITYIGNMTSLLNCEAHERSQVASTKIRHPFGLLDAEGKDIVFGTLKSWSVLQHLEEHPDKSARKLAKLIRRRGKNPISFEQATEFLDTIPNYALVIDTVVAKYLTRDRCDLAILDSIPPDGVVEGYAFLTKSYVDLSHKFKECVSESLRGDFDMYQNRISRTTWSKWINEHKYGRCNTTHQPQQEIPPKPYFVPINVLQFFGPLALVGLGLILCVLVTIAEIVIHFISNKLKKVNILGASSPIEEERRLHDDLDDDLKA